MPLLESMYILDIPAEILAAGLKAWKKWANQVSYSWRFLYNKQQELVATESPLFQLNSFLFLLLFKYMCRYL